MPLSPPCLLIECAITAPNHQASIALVLADGTISAPHFFAPHSHAAELVTAIQTLLGNHQLDFKDLSSLIATIGPGSFTGIRIGLSVARTLCFANPAMQAIGLSSLQAAVTSVSDVTNGRVALHAGKGELFCQSFQRGNHGWQAMDEISIVAPQDMPGDLPLITNAPQLIEHPTHIITFDATLLWPALEVLPETEQHLYPLAPLYVRAPDAKLPKQA